MGAATNVVDIAGAVPSPGLPGWLAAGLARLDARLQVAVAAAVAAYGPHAADDPNRGLYIGDDEVQRLLARSPAVPFLGANPQQLLLVDDDAAGSSLSRLGRRLDLEPLDLDIVLVALAPELDLRYERLYGYLQDDVTRRRPSVDLALNLLCTDAGAKVAGRRRFAFDAPLRRHRVLEFAPAPSRGDPPLLAQDLRLDDQVVRVLLADHGLDARLAGCARLDLEPCGSLEELSAICPDARAMAALACAARAAAAPLRFSFEGRPGSGRTRAAAALAGELGMALLVADLARAIVPATDAEARLGLLLREARLHDAVLLLADVDVLGAADHTAELDIVLRELESHPGIVVLAGSRPFAATRTATRRRPATLQAISFPLPDAATRRACWDDRLALSGIAASADAVDALGGRFRLTAGQIADAVDAVGERLAQRAARDGHEPAAPTADDLFAAARAQSTSGLATLAQKVTPRRRFGDIVLPADRLEQLRDICNTVHRRALVYDDWGFGDRLSLGKGLNVLFSGPSGTGKTLAAEILAAELGLELYKIDLSTVVSKYIGETEKNLERIFSEAEMTSAILFFDEADALFGKRSEVKDAHDRYANIEIGYLLQRMEEYGGTVILATNLARNMDNAFMRRMQFTLDFPLPDEANRLRIWRGIWPAATPLHPDLDLAALAGQIELSGGHIRNIAVAAAFLAADDGAVAMEHVLRATRREYQKLGQMVPGNTIERE